MKGRYASGIFALAVLVCWVGLMIAQQVKPLPKPSGMLIRPAAEMQGVRRVVWDVDINRFEVDTSDRATTVFAAWAGDMRLSVPWRRAGAPVLVLVLEREGDTVYVRAQEVPQAQETQAWEEEGEGEHPQQRQRNRSGYVPTPDSLTLPAGVEEIIWPKLNLLVAQNALAPLPRFTVHAHDVRIGGNERMYLEDPLLRETQKGDRIPGRLQRLQVYSSLGSTKCASDGSDGHWQSGSLSYEGGIFEELQLYVQGGEIRLAALEPGLKAQLFLSPKTGLSVREHQYLSAIQIHPLSDDLRAQLHKLPQAPERVDGRCSR